MLKLSQQIFVQNYKVMNDFKAIFESEVISMNHTVKLVPTVNKPRKSLPRWNMYLHNEEQIEYQLIMN